MANAISILIEAKNNASQALQQVSDEIKATGNSADEAAPQTGRFESALGVLGSRLRFVAETFAIYKIGQSVADFASSSVAAAGQLEQTNVSFQNLIGNVKEANSLFGQLVQYANVTPFQAKDVTDAAKQLLAFGQTAKQTITTVKQLGDVASAGGGDLQAMALVTGQVFAQGKLRAQDMYQVINDGGAGLIKIMAANVGGMQNLTKEFDTGGIPAQQYFDAINQATAKGGFAFDGAQKQAQTLNGRLSTLKDSATQFGEALLGVHTDPQLGLQIQPGGLFDRMRNGILNVSNALQSWEPAVQAAVPQFIDGLQQLGGRITSVVGPAFDGLWKVISTQLMPALLTLWHNVLEPLAPYLAGAFLLAVRGIVDVFTDLLRIVSPVLQFLGDHTYVVYALAAAFAAMGTSMALGAAFDAITVGIATIQLVSLPGLVASIGAMSAAWTAAFPVAAILADIALVAAAVNSVLGTWNTLQKVKAGIAADQKSTNTSLDQIAANIKSGKSATSIQTLYSLQQSDGYTGGNPVYKTGNTYTFGFASGTQFAPGGRSLVGEDGPEIVDLPTGSKVTPARETAQQLGGSKSVNIENFNVYNQVDANAVIRKIGFKLATA